MRCESPTCRELCVPRVWAKSRYSLDELPIWLCPKCLRVMKSEVVWMALCAHSTYEGNYDELVHDLLLDRRCR